MVANRVADRAVAGPNSSINRPVRGQKRVASRHALPLSSCNACVGGTCIFWAVLVFASPDWLSEAMPYHGYKGPQREARLKFLCMVCGQRMPPGTQSVGFFNSTRPPPFSHQWDRCCAWGCEMLYQPPPLQRGQRSSTTGADRSSPWQPPPRPSVAGGSTFIIRDSSSSSSASGQDNGRIELFKLGECLNYSQETVADLLEQHGGNLMAVYDILVGVHEGDVILHDKTSNRCHETDIPPEPSLPPARPPMHNP